MFTTGKWSNTDWLWLIITNFWFWYWSCQRNPFCHPGPAWWWWILHIMQQCWNTLQDTAAHSTETERGDCRLLQNNPISKDIPREKITNRSPLNYLMMINRFTHQIGGRCHSSILIKVGGMMVKVITSPHHPGVACSSKKWWLLLTIVHSSQVFSVIFKDWSKR